MATGFPKNLQDRLCVLPLHDGVLFEFFFKLCNALQIFSLLGEPREIIMHDTAQCCASIPTLHTKQATEVTCTWEICTVIHTTAVVSAQSKVCPVDESASEFQASCTVGLPPNVTIRIRIN